MTSVLFSSLAARTNATNFGKVSPSAQFASIQPSVDICTFGAIRAKHLKDKDAFMNAMQQLENLQGGSNTLDNLEQKQSLADGIINFLMRDKGQQVPIDYDKDQKKLTITGTPYAICMSARGQNDDTKRRATFPFISIENTEKEFGKEVLYSSNNQTDGAIRLSSEGGERETVLRRSRLTAEHFETLVGDPYSKAKYKFVPHQ